MRGRVSSALHGAPHSPLALHALILASQQWQQGTLYGLCCIVPWLVLACGECPPGLYPLHFREFGLNKSFNAMLLCCAQARCGGLRRASWARTASRRPARGSTSPASSSRRWERGGQLGPTAVYGRWTDCVGMIGGRISGQPGVVSVRECHVEYWTPKFFKCVIMPCMCSMHSLNTARCNTLLSPITHTPRCCFRAEGAHTARDQTCFLLRAWRTGQTCLNMQCASRDACMHACNVDDSWMLASNKLSRHAR